MSKKRNQGVLVCALVMLIGCQKEFSNQLQGKWQLKTVEQSGNVTPIDTVWYNFQSESLFMYQVYRAETDAFIHQYGYKTQPDENVIRLELTAYPRPVNDFLPVTDWGEGTRTFVVKKINGKHLVLQCDDKTYRFARF
jgi:hypothetical protein